LFRLFAIFVSLLTVSIHSYGEDAHHHSALGEQELGTVHFPISCSSTVQKSFERGVALLHSFAFETAEATFREVARNDPKCAMAHWGIARSFWRWSWPDGPTLNHGWQEVVLAKSLHPATKREEEYIDSIAALFRNPENRNEQRWDNYTGALKRLHSDYPDDHEATAFYAAALTGTDQNDPTHERRREAAALLEPLFATEPDHPGVAHYLIHAYDTPGLAQLGLPAARRYASIAPAAPHALHMPSHIFARLGLWQEDIDSNLASLAASRNADATHMEDKGHQFHAMEFLMYAYLQCGRESDAQRLMEEVKTLPLMKDMYGVGFDPRISALANYSATYALELHDWKMAESLPQLSGEELGDLAGLYFVRALGAAHLGHVEEAKRDAIEMETVRTKLQEQHKDWIANAVEQDHGTVLAWIAHAEGRNEDAVQGLSALAENDEGLFSAEGELPGHEMLADLLMELNRPQEALVQYRAELKINPNRFDSLYGAGLAAEKSNQTKEAASFYDQFLNVCSVARSSRPEVTHAQAYRTTMAGTK